ncbi:hypothetical protein SAMN05192534_103108 [Alteribacillus persepolensis]|uniref:Uncharacterized protein n=1 Tax=Alteribacillus persepolensis TaxID=568899 RepID=A0A1G8B131_9BACI|nr:hypothetical protein [Alteribacillus persepolensis]SDH26992.1 hypothetical protein SAMN05192534_103108 [Alteribacillus persepolensis]
MWYRIISFVVITAFVSVMVHLHLENSHVSGEAHYHEVLHVPKNQPVPDVSGKLMKDNTEQWLLMLEVENFTFTPEKVGTNKGSYHEGHAHLYINGTKQGRLYGHYYDLGSLQEGDIVQVVLATNQHQLLYENESLIAYQEEIGVQ